MLDRLNDGVAVLSADGWFEYVNDPAGEMLERPPSELLGRCLWDEFPGSTALHFHVAFNEALQTDEPRYVVDFYPPLDRWFEARLFPQDDRIVSLFRDVTDQKRAEEDLHESAERIAEAERIVGFGVWEWEVSRNRIHWSEELHRIYGLRPGEFDGTVEAFLERVHPDDRETVWENVSHSLRTLEPFAFEERILRADGEERLLISQGRVLAEADGSARALVGVCHDVTDRARVEEALGTSERRMHEIVDNTPSLITVKDLDGRYLMGNAEAARLAGMSVAEMLGKHCAEVFPAAISERQRLNDRRAASEGEPVYDEATLIRDGEPRSYLTVTFPLHDEQRLPVEICTIATDVTERKERESERRERRDWTERIAAALDERRLLVYSQPIVDLATGVHCADELLVRMRGGDHGQILAPETFLLAAERFELIQAIDVWMVRQALAMPSEVIPQVNLSAVTLSDPDAREEIIELLTAAPPAARRIVFEITETASVVRLQAAREFAAAATELECRLALDDFGVGFGSFTYLRSLPLSYIKVDTGFVRGVTRSAEDRRVVRGIIGVAHHFGLQTIVEGVENEETLELVRELGADFGQGFHLGRPAPAGALLA